MSDFIMCVFRIWFPNVVILFSTVVHLYEDKDIVRWYGVPKKQARCISLWL